MEEVAGLVPTWWRAQQTEAQLARALTEPDYPPISVTVPAPEFDGGPSVEQQGGVSRGSLLGGALGPSHTAPAQDFYIRRALLAPPPATCGALKPKRAPGAVVAGGDPSLHLSTSLSHAPPPLPSAASSGGERPA
jgi:hypothetical protein